MNLSFVNEIFYIVIVSTTLFFLMMEWRLSKRYRSQLAPWRIFGDRLVSGTVKNASVPSQLNTVVEQYFLKASNGDFSKQGDKYQLSVPVKVMLPHQPTSPYRFVPALLTTTGVLGTFLGISMGLGGVKALGADSAQLMESATTLLIGMQTAFYTSLAGLFFSIVFTGLHTLMSKYRELAHRSLVLKYQTLCIAVSPVGLLHKLSPVGQDELINKQLRAAESIISSNLQMAEITQLLSHVLKEFNAPKLASVISESVSQAVTRELARPLESLPKAVEELRAIKEDNGREMIEILTGAIKEQVVVPMAEQTKAVNAAVNASTASVEQLAGQLSGMLDGLGATTDSLNEFQKDTLTKLQGFADSLRVILTQFKDDTEGALDRVAGEINHALESSIEGMGSQREAFEQSADRAATAFEKQNKTLELVGSGSSKLMNEAKDNLLEGLSTIDEKVKTMSAVTQQELERFRVEYQENMSHFFSQQENLLEQTLGKQREGLAGVVTDFRQVFEDEHKMRREQFSAVTSQYVQLQEGVALVQELVEAVGMNKSAAFDQLNDTARSVSAQVGKLRQSYDEAAERFNKMTEQMPEAMSQYFEVARNGNDRFFEQFDDSAAKVHGKLAEAASLLVTAMQTIEMHRIEFDGEPA